ncbi:head GIN domain-containing protein [Pedobacter sp. AW1-32]|uniref:head GIN domain-containing protein n=1 Tax=Pedobacter sp. AW1-32 TaxID=3383026 RepID=UPI003FF103EE
MKKTFHAIILLMLTIGVLSVSAQSSKNFTVKSFNTISVSSGIDLYLTQGSSESVNIKTDAETMASVVVEQEGQSIRIKFKDGFSWSRAFKNRSIKAYVNVKSLSGLNASGGSDVYGQNPIKTDKLTINSSGGSDLKLDLICGDLSISSSGGSDLDLSGRVQNLVIHSSGGSDVDAFNLVAQYAKVESSGGSDVNVNVEKGIEAGASGGSDITYKGSAGLRKTSNSKSGSVRHSD